MSKLLKPKKVPTQEELDKQVLEKVQRDFERLKIRIKDMENYTIKVFSGTRYVGTPSHNRHFIVICDQKTPGARIGFDTWEGLPVIGMIQMPAEIGELCDLLRKTDNLLEELENGHPEIISVRIDVSSAGRMTHKFAVRDMERAVIAIKDLLDKYLIEYKKIVAA